MKKILCFFIGHSIIEGKFFFNNGDYYTKRLCRRCRTHFGLPTMTDEFIQRNYPIPEQFIPKPETKS
jgi:hypothetical protein